MPLSVGLVVGVCGFGIVVAYSVYFCQLLWCPPVVYMPDEKGVLHEEGAFFVDSENQDQL